MSSDIGQLSTLVDALCTIHLGWTTNPQKDEYDAACKQISSHAQIVAAIKKRKEFESRPIEMSEIYAALGLIASKIERCGASRELTDAVCAVSDLRAAVGNEYNPPKQYALNSVRKLIVESKH